MMSKSASKRKVKVRGGPYDGMPLWLSGQTLTFIVGEWCGFYHENGVWFNEQKIQDVSQYSSGFIPFGQPFKMK